MTTQDGTSPIPTGDTNPDEWAGPGSPGEPTPGGGSAPRQWAGPGSAGKGEAPIGDPDEWAGPGGAGKGEAPIGDPDEWAGPGGAGRTARPESGSAGSDMAYDDGDSRIFPEGDG